jgi:HK97 family phage major capsid protein
MDQMTQLEKLQTQAEETDHEIRKVEASVEAENRTMNPDEIAKVRDLTAKFEQLTAEIDLRRKTELRAATLTAPQPRKVDPLPTTATPVPTAGATSHTFTGGTPAAHNFRNHGFEKGPGEFLVAVMNASTSRRPDPRLMVNAVSTYGNESVGADGAFALPPAFASGLMNAVIPQDSFLAAMNPVQTNSNLLVVPVNEKAYWQNSSGITGAKTAEGAAITASKAAISEVRVPLYKYASLVHVSEETLADIPFMASWVMNEMGNHLRWLLEDAVMNGSGEGNPLGILNASSTIAISDADSTATAIGAVDVLTMEANLLNASGAFWVGNPTVFPAIAAMKTGSAGYPLFQQDITLPSKQALLGRPFYRSEASPILNTTGDLCLIAPGGFIFATKAGGVQTATTVGFAFDQDLQSFRATLRAGFAPVLSAKVARAKSTGSTYASNSVVITGSRS